MIQFVFLFFIPLLINASTKNVFLIGDVDSSNSFKPMHLQVPARETIKEEEILKNNRLFEMKINIQQAVKDKKAYLYFANLSSIKFHIDHCLELSEEWNLLKQRLLICYKMIKLTISLYPTDDVALIRHSSNSKLASKLIKLLEDISNNLSKSHDDYHARIDKIVASCTRIEQFINNYRQSQNSNTIDITESPTNQKDNNSPKITKSESRWSRLKRAFAFLKETFDTLPSDYSAAQKKEYDENSFYIKLGNKVIIGTVAILGFTFFISIHRAANNWFIKE